MRPLPQVDPRKGTGVEPTIGRNLPIVVKPDHLRRDGQPPKRAYVLRSLMDMYYVGGSDSSDDVVKVVLSTPDGQKALLPCTGIGYDGRELRIYAEVDPLCGDQAAKTVVEMPFQTPFYLRWPDGWVSKESFWHGLVLDYGPCQMSADLYSDGTVEEVGRPGYRSTRGVRWFRTREEAEAAS